MRPTRKQAEASMDDFVEVIRAALNSKTKVTLEQVGKYIGLQGSNITSTMSNKLADKNFDDIQRADALRYIYDERKIFSAHWRDDIKQFDHALYFALVNFFDLHETSRDNVRGALAGTFELWRHSVEDDTEFVHGKIAFSADTETGEALCVEMTQKRHDKAGVRGGVEKFSGYLIRVAEVYLMILGENSTHHPRITIFPWPREETYEYEKNGVTLVGTRIAELDGFALGRDGPKIFFSPVFLSRVDEDKVLALDNTLDVIEQTVVPPTIVRRLAKFPFLTL
jgi:hypothetical protein